MDYELLKPFIETFFLVPRNDSDQFSTRDLKRELFDEEFEYDDIQIN